MIGINEYIKKLRSMPEFGKYLVSALTKLEDSVNLIGRHVGVNPTGGLPAPSPVQGLAVKAASGFVHVAITDNSPANKNLQYFVEYDTDPAFKQPHVIDMGASRTHPPFALPANNDGAAAQSFYFRAYSQYHGSPAGKKVNFGGTAPTAVSPGGTVNMTLLPSTGSGTASPFGTQGGQGLGTVISRPQVGPKRTSK